MRAGENFGGHLTVVLILSEQKLNGGESYTNGADAYDSSFNFRVIDLPARKVVAKAAHGPVKDFV